MCGYAAASIGNGLSPDDARRAALDVAAELAELAAALRRLTRLDLDAAQRRALAVELAASGLFRSGRSASSSASARKPCGPICGARNG